MARVLSSSLLILLLAVLLSACGGDDEEPGAEREAQRPVTLKVGVLPIADLAPLHLGIDKGFFEEERLNIEPQPAAGGAAIVPAVISGDFQIGFSNVVSPIVARSKGLPLEIIASGSNAGDDDAKVLVSEDGRIKGLGDLAGKTIAVNTLNNIATVTLNAALREQGVDISSIKYVELDFPEMQSALERGRVDAVWLKEPFITRAERAGAREIVNPYTSIARNLSVGVYLASQSYIEKNEAVVERFVKALQKSMEFAQRNPAEVRRIMTTFTEIPPEAARAMDLPNWSGELNRSHIELLADLSRKDGLVEGELDVSELIHE